jgi:hypothetical protein
MQTDADFVSAALNQSKDQAIPFFYMKDVKNNFKSNEAGHPVYDKKEYVRVVIPGDRNSVPDREVRESDKSRWPKLYVAFKNNQELAPDGMPLEKWPLVDINQVEFLKHWNIRTVEQLANINDMHIQKLGMGARDLRSKAIVYLEQARDGSGISRLVQERETLTARVKDLESQVQQLAATASAAKTQAAAQPVTGAASPAMSPEAIQQLVAQSVAAALSAAAPPKNKGGRPKKVQTPEHELPDEDSE